jgi:molecular chaperone Hsp33
MADRIIRGTGSEGGVRFVAVDCTDAVKTATRLHKLSASNSLVLGKLICAGLLMGSDIKTEKGVISLSTESDGNESRSVVTVNGRSEVKAWISQPQKEINPDLLNKNGYSVDSLVLGKGTLNVIKDLGIKTPYSGKVEMKFGNLAKDITYYYAVSEQIPTSISLGVLITESGRIRKAGGFLVQLLPGCPEDSVSKLERNIMSFPNFTDVLDMGYSLESIAEKMILKDLGINLLGEMSPKYKCGCSRSKMKAVAGMLKRDEIIQTVEESGFVEVKCHFCSRSYRFYKNDLPENFS